MMAKHVSLFLAVFFTFGACIAGEAKKGKIVDYEVYVDQIVHQFSREMKKDYDFRCIGDGGKMPHDVEEISVDFIVYKRALVEEARILEVKATERLLRLINAHEKIRPFLREYPFKASRVNVSISFHNLSNSYFTDGSVAFVFQAKGKLFYSTIDTPTKKLIDLYEEPYETALKIVNEAVKKEDPKEKK